ncbi:hypothetical protein Tco_0484224 [Tanacetum coccineum]
MIITNNRIEDKKPLGHMLPLMGSREKGHYANQCLKANNRPPGSLLTKRQDCFVRIRISTLETTPEDTQVIEKTMAQSGMDLKMANYKAVNKEIDGSLVRAATTASSLEAE